MAWTAPMTATDGSQYTADQYNTQIRDNLLAMAPAKATGERQYFVSNGANSITSYSPETQYIPNEESASGGAGPDYIDLDTPGPSITMDTGERALVFFRADGKVDTANFINAVILEVTGATTFQDFSTVADGRSEANAWRTLSGWRLMENLNPGTNTITMKYYAVSTSQVYTYRFRSLSVMPF